ncbi:hypothetical protein WJX72_003462 [[Myrmecia] bisecta]|uniref:Uncharacterized protein n=1 Tax=[Myrmecia] bisecta TaxID=41462 RepID=A0AAW1PAL0_9CHLO
MLAAVLLAGLASRLALAGGDPGSVPYRRSLQQVPATAPSNRRFGPAPAPGPVALPPSGPFVLPDPSYQQYVDLANGLSFSSTNAVEVLRTFQLNQVAETVVWASTDTLLDFIKRSANGAQLLASQGHCQIATTLSACAHTAIAIHGTILNKDYSAAIDLVKQLSFNVEALKQALLTNAPCTPSGAGSYDVVYLGTQIVWQGAYICDTHIAFRRQVSTTIITTITTSLTTISHRSVL